jgi:hypothetical protein
MLPKGEKLVEHEARLPLSIGVQIDGTKKPGRLLAKLTCPVGVFPE